jgi:hypothetical protein
MIDQKRKMGCINTPHFILIHARHEDILPAMASPTGGQVQAIAVETLKNPEGMI